MKKINFCPFMRDCGLGMKNMYFSKKIDYFVVRQYPAEKENLRDLCLQQFTQNKKSYDKMSNLLLNQIKFLNCL
jgi:hypothetical protein